MATAAGSEATERNRVRFFGRRFRRASTARPARLRAAIGCLGLIVVIAGCGGGKDIVYGGPSVESNARTVAKITVPASDFISSDAPTSFDFTLSNGDSGTVAVWGTLGKAKATMDQVPVIWKAFAKALGATGKPHAERHGNVTIFWDQAPNADDEAAVGSMLARTPSATALPASQAGSTTVRDTTTAGAAPTGDPATITGWHEIGSFDIGMQKTAVVYKYGYGQPDQYASALYKLHGGTVELDYGNAKVGFPDRIIQLSTTSPYYKAPGGIAVGTAVPLPACQTASGKCTRRWAGFTLGQDPTTGATAWQRYVHYAGHKLVVEAIIDKSRIRSFIIGVCGIAWACPAH